MDDNDGGLWDDVARRTDAQHNAEIIDLTTVKQNVNPTEPPPLGDGFFIDWPTFWEQDRDEHEWLVDQILARGRGHAIYAAMKTGKSLFTLGVVVDQAVQHEDVEAMYLDYEMTNDDVYERLTDMGYGPDTDLSRFHYALLPSIPPLDTAEGAAALLEKIDEVQAAHPASHLVVVLDTTSRAVAGEESSADTIRAFYRYTGLALKQRQVTWVRLDHAGKDVERGQRGSSAKGDDVDIVWRLIRTDDGFKLHRDAARMGWVPENVTLHKHTDPIRFTIAAAAWPAGTKGCADRLDELGVPVKTTVRVARAALREAGYPASATVLSAALKHRRNAPVPPPPADDTF